MLIGRQLLITIPLYAELFQQVLALDILKCSLIDGCVSQYFIVILQCYEFFDSDI